MIAQLSASPSGVREIVDQTSSVITRKVSALYVILSGVGATIVTFVVTAAVCHLRRRALKSEVVLGNFQVEADVLNPYPSGNSIYRWSR